MHKNNIHNKSYDFKLLTKNEKSLEQYVFLNKYDVYSIDFSNSLALISLNKALLKTYYDISYWEIPKNFLCPPIPGRADYIHYIADLLKSNKNILGLDVGVGANCIYPILGNSIYKWKFICSDINGESIKNANNIVFNNKNLKNNVKIILQEQKHHIFNSIINENDKIDFTICNPPFHSSSVEALKANNKKNKNLNIDEKALNFGGMANELYYKNGEAAFIKKLIKESIIYKNNVLWFTCLISKQENLKNIQKQLAKLKPYEVKIIQMQQGNKISRFVAWTFLNLQEQNIWYKNKENND